MGAVTCVASRRQHKGSITTAGMVAGIELGHMPQRECQHNGDGSEAGWVGHDHCANARDVSFPTCIASHVAAPTLTSLCIHAC